MSLHQRPPVICVHSSHRTRCGHRLSPPSIEDARAFCRSFFRWYNEAHRHSGIGLLAPAMVHSGLAPEVQAARAVTLERAYAAQPERFVQ